MVEAGEYNPNEMKWKNYVDEKYVEKYVYVEMKNYVDEYLHGHGDVYANYFDHLSNMLGYQSPWILVRASVYFTI